MNLGLEKYQSVVSGLEPQVDYGPDGESKDEPWSNVGKFDQWLSAQGFTDADRQAWITSVPLVTLSMNHGPLFGVERFIEVNSCTDHQILKAGFVIVGRGPNGDCVVVDIAESRGQTGWLPMGMIRGMPAASVREHFVATNPSLGDFVKSSEEDWSNVPKDWHDARNPAND